METEHLFQSGHTHFTELTKSFPAISTELETPNIKEKTKFSANLPIIGSVTQQNTNWTISCAQFTRLDFLFLVCTYADFSLQKFFRQKSK